MRILFVSHTGGRSGAENAMLRLLDALPDLYERVVALPDGPFVAPLQERGVRCVALSGTDVSFRLHPVHTPVGLFELARSSWQTMGAVRRSGAQIVHANTLRAGLLCAMVRAVGGPPLLVQCHDHLPEGITSRLTRAVIARTADAVVGVSQATVDSFNEGLAAPKAERIFISIDHGRFHPGVPATDLHAELGLTPGARVVGQVGQITPWKGQDVAIEALALARRELDVHLVIAGSVSFQSHRYDNDGFHRSLLARISALGLEDAVHFLGQRTDVPQVMRALDALVMPSWDEPFGTAAAECMAVGTPVLVTASGGPREYVEDGVTGHVLRHDDPAAWAQALVSMLADDERRVSMGQASVVTAAGFRDDRYASEMAAVYERLASGSPSAA